jgi:hypothetical protein
VDEEYLDRVRAYQLTEPYKIALRKRSVWLEPLFAEGKDWHGMRRLRLRELERVNYEAADQKARLGTASLSGRSRFLLPFSLVWMVVSSLFGICVSFYDYSFTFTSEQAHIHFVFLMSFAEGFSTDLSRLLTILTLVLRR